MTEAKLTYLGPGPKLISAPRRPWHSRVPWAFLILVVVPTLVTAIYYLFIATPRYVSEARFIVRAQSQQAPSALGFALQGVGISTTQTDAFAVHEYIQSRQALSDLERTMDLRDMLGSDRADPLSRLPRPWEGPSNEAFHSGFERFIVVGYDSRNGMSTLRVQAFTPRDANIIANALLDGGEGLINRLNDRSANTAVVEAQRAVDDAEEEISSTQLELTRFRNQEQFIDPQSVARESSEVLSGLLLARAELLVERQQLVSEAPQSPLLAQSSARLAALDAQIEAQRQRVAGSPQSLAPKVGAYEDLLGRRELAARNLASASDVLVSARQDARRQKLYLERVVSPSLADKSSEPKRFLSILTVFGTMLLLYGVGWLIWAGVKEHRQQ